MTEKEFTDIASDLRNLALKHGRLFVRESDAEDVAQDTMLRLWSLHASLPSAVRTKGLAVTIARHLAIDLLRRQKKYLLIKGTLRALADGHTVSPQQASPEDALVYAENEQWLRRHLKQLPSNEYQVLHLRQVEKKSSQEIAAILGIKVASVPVLLSRARRKLYEEIRKK